MPILENELIDSKLVQQKKKFFTFYPASGNQQRVLSNKFLRIFKSKNF